MNILKNCQNNILQKGTAVIISFLTLGTLLILGFYFLSFTLLETKISKSQVKGMETYYLSEAGINEAIWKLKNDEVITDGDDPWKQCFVTSTAPCVDCDTWSDTFIRNYGENTTTTVSINNTQCGRGEIIATSTVLLSNNITSQRVVKIKIFKALGSLTENSPIFAGAPSGETTIQSSILNVYDGNILSNNNLNIKLGSVINIYDNQSTPEQEGQVLAVQNINITASTLNSSSTCSKNLCTGGICEQCPSDTSEMPAIDFNSASSDSYYSKAQAAESQGQCSVIGRDSSSTTVITVSQCVFSESEFKDLLWDIGKGGILVLEHKTNGTATSTYYVTGGVELRGGRSLEINGVLVVDGTIDIGEKAGWKGEIGLNQITIIDPGEGTPSGLLTKGKMNFGTHSSFATTSITGLLYAQDQMRFTGVPNSVCVTGGLLARKISIASCWDGVSIYLDNGIIREGVWGGSELPGGGAAPFSPIVTIEHWEETY